MQYSQGFHPQGKSVANPLPLVYSGLNELVDLWIEPKPAEDIKIALNKACQWGIAVHQVDIMPDNSPSLPKQVLYSDYKIHFFDSIDLSKNSTLKIEDLLARKASCGFAIEILRLAPLDHKPEYIAGRRMARHKLTLHASSPPKPVVRRKCCSNLGFEWSILVSNAPDWYFRSIG
jgi:hypothetical protein